MKRDGLARAVLTIAEKLGKFPYEVKEQLTLSEVAEIMGYFQYLQNEEEAERKRQERKQGRSVY